MLTTQVTPTNPENLKPLFDVSAMTPDVPPAPDQAPITTEDGVQRISDNLNPFYEAQGGEENTPDALKVGEMIVAQEAQIDFPEA